jgi:hypothetical protein
MRTLVHLPDVACFSFKFVSFDLFVGSAHAARHPPASAVSDAAGRREARYPCNRLHRCAQLPGRRCGFCALPASRSRIPATTMHLRSREIRNILQALVRIFAY